MSTFELLSEVNESFVRKSAKTMTDLDLIDVLKHKDQILTELQKPGPLANLKEPILDLWGMVDAYSRIEFAGLTPFKLQVATYALKYLLADVDLLPNKEEGIGHMDDAALVAICLDLLKDELKEYKKVRV